MRPFKTHRFLALVPICLAAVTAGGAGAQMPDASSGMPSSTMPSAGMPSTGMPSMNMPDISSIGGSNAAGVLSYCAKNKLIDQAQGNSVYSALTKKPDVAQDSTSYSSGAAGNIMGGDGKTLSLDKAPKQVRQKACDMVLKQSKSLL